MKDIQAQVVVTQVQAQEAEIQLDLENIYVIGEEVFTPDDCLSEIVCNEKIIFGGSNLKNNLQIIMDSDYFNLNDSIDYLRDNLDDEEDFMLLGLGYDEFDPDLIGEEHLMQLYKNNSRLAFEAILNGDTLSGSRSIGTLAHEYACHIKAHGDNLL